MPPKGKRGSRSPKRSGSKKRGSASPKGAKGKKSNSPKKKKSRSPKRRGKHGKGSPSAKHKEPPPIPLAARHVIRIAVKSAASAHPTEVFRGVSHEEEEYRKYTLKKKSHYLSITGFGSVEFYRQHREQEDKRRSTERSDKAELLERQEQQNEAPDQGEASEVEFSEREETSREGIDWQKDAARMAPPEIVKILAKAHRRVGRLHHAAAGIWSQLFAPTMEKMEAALNDSMSPRSTVNQSGEAGLATPFPSLRAREGGGVVLGTGHPVMRVLEGMAQNRTLGPTFMRTAELTRHEYLRHCEFTGGTGRCLANGD